MASVCTFKGLQETEHRVCLAQVTQNFCNALKPCKIGREKKSRGKLRAQHDDSCREAHTERVDTEKNSHSTSFDTIYVSKNLRAMNVKFCEKQISL